MDKEKFRIEMIDFLNKNKSNISTKDDEWIMKGFIDVYKNIYPLSIDTKVISKVIELLLFPEILKFANKKNYEVLLPEHQNHYPDITFVTPEDEKIAVDIKSNYVKDNNKVNGFTLGTFTGYFRDRKTTKNILFPYEEYSGHFVLGVIYERTEENDLDKFKKYDLDKLDDIVSVAKNFKIIFQEKWKISSDKPGSGNTRNIGSVKNINDLINGTGKFSKYGEKVFDDYWMNYLTNEMSQSIDSPIKYRNIEEYIEYKHNL